MWTVKMDVEMSLPAGPTESIITGLRHIKRARFGVITVCFRVNRCSKIYAEGYIG